MSLTRREAIIATAATATAARPARAAQAIAPYKAACVHTRVIPTITGAGVDADARAANIDEGFWRCEALFHGGEQGMPARQDFRVWLFAEECDCIFCRSGFYI